MYTVHLCIHYVHAYVHMYNDRTNNDFSACLALVCVVLLLRKETAHE